MGSKYQITEDAISDAITTSIKIFPSTLTEAAMTYNVAPCIVQQRLFEVIGSQSSRWLPHRALNPQQEQVIQHYLIWQDVAGISANLSMLFGATNYLFKQSHLDHCTLPTTVSPCWLWQFRNRCKQFFIKKQKPLAIDWKNARKIKDFTIYFKKYKEIRIQRGLTDADV